MRRVKALWGSRIQDDWAFRPRHQTTPYIYTIARSPRSESDVAAYVGVPSIFIGTRDSGVTTPVNGTMTVYDDRHPSVMLQRGGGTQPNWASRSSGGEQVDALLNMRQK